MLLFFKLHLILFKTISGQTCIRKQRVLLRGREFYATEYYCCRHFVNTNKGCEECPSGYTPNENKTQCDPCQYGLFGERCAATCHCEDITERCDNVKGCILRSEGAVTDKERHETQTTNEKGQDKNETQNDSETDGVNKNLLYIGIGLLVLVILILAAFVCIREKRRKQKNSNNETEPAQEQRNEMQTYNSVNEYEEIDERLMQDVLSQNENVCPNNEYGDDNTGENDLQSGYLNPYQPVEPEVDIRKYSSLHGVEVESIGSKGDIRNSGYLHPYQPLSPPMKSSDKDYSKLENMTDPELAKTKHGSQQVINSGGDYLTDEDSDKNRLEQQ